MDFKRAEELYQLEWTARPRTERIGEFDVPFPKIPPEREMLNYELKTKEQKFIVRTLPKELMYWDEQKREEFIAAEWHRRLNGYWILIKGHPMYIPGSMDLMCNYWTKATGGRPDFRISALQFHRFWQFCELDPNCFGFAVWKPRRIGDTENTLCIGWEYITRYRNFPMGMQHTKEDDVFKSYMRVVKGNNGMPFYFKPVHKGSTEPTNGLYFEIPSERISRKSVQDKESSVYEQGLGSSVTYASSTTGAYDGDFLGFYYLDEVFKQKIHRLHPMDQLRIIRPCLAYFNDDQIIGKAILTSTVEHIESKNPNAADANTLQVANDLWKDCDPNVRDENGRTVSGLYRLFRDYKMAAKPDEWGFPQHEKATVKRNNKIKFFQEHQKFDELLSLQRKQPASIEEALAAASHDCILYPELCEMRLYQINNGLSRYGKEFDKAGRKIKRRDVYGELVWKNGIWFGEVEWIPNNNGKWCFSQLPTHVNSKVYINGKAYPGNTRLYGMGIDPYDSATIQGKGSDGAFVVKRRLDLYAEEGLEFDENGEVVNPEDMITDQIICDYKYRQRDPYDYYDDVLKTMVFCGCLGFVERDKPGFMTWMINKGLTHWLQNKPKHFWTSRQRKGEIGSKATQEIISQYVDLLKAMIPRRIWCCHHPRVINDWKFFSVDKRTQFDLAVASGFAEMATINDHFSKEEVEVVSGWENELYE